MANPHHQIDFVETQLEIFPFLVQFSLHLSFKVDWFGVFFPALLLVKVVQDDLDAFFGCFVALTFVVWEKHREENDQVLKLFDLLSSVFIFIFLEDFEIFRFFSSFTFNFLPSTIRVRVVLSSTRSFLGRFLLR